MDTCKSHGVSPAFSVLMCYYVNDNPAWLRDALQSLANQTANNFELVLVRDGPVEMCLEDVVSEFRSILNISEICLTENRGLAHALNAGIEVCRTKFVFRMDADDICASTRFEAQLPYLRAGYDVVGSAIEEFDEEGRKFIRLPPTDPQKIKGRLKFRNPFNHMTVGFNVDCVRLNGGYPALFLKEDYGLWIKMISGGCRVMNLAEPLVRARVGKGFIRRRGGLLYIKSEVALGRYLYIYRISSLFLVVSTIFLRSLVFMLPSTLRKKFYQRFLRKKRKV